MSFAYESQLEWIFKQQQLYRGKQFYVSNHSNASTTLIQSADASEDVFSVFCIQTFLI